MICYKFFLGFSLCLCCLACTNQGNSVKFQQYYVAGQELYRKHCANCHQRDGTGLGQVYPPLYKSDFMDANFKEALCLIRYGKEGEVMVNGVMYNQPMQGISSLTDLEIAEVATYIYNTWGHTRGLVDVSEAATVLADCK